MNSEMNSILSMMKFIGNRLNKIEATLSDIQIEGITTKVKLDFTVDGYELVKKTVNYDPTEPIANYDIPTVELLETLEEDQKLAIIHRLGLMNHKAKKFKHIGKILNRSLGYARDKYISGLKKCRWPANIELASKQIDPRLKSAIFDEEDKTLE